MRFPQIVASSSWFFLTSKIKGDGQECPSHTLGADEDDFWVEECARHSCGDRNQVALAGEDFYVTGPGEFEEIDGASVTDSGNREFVRGYGRHLREEFTRVDEELK